MNIKIVLVIFWKTAKESIYGKSWKFLFGGLGSFIALLLLGKNFLGTSLQTSIIIGIGILSFLFIIRFTLLGIRNSVKHLHEYYRESKYGDAIILLKEAFSKFHWLRKKSEYSDEELMSCLIFLCDKLQVLFSRKNFSDCSVSIKVPIKGNITADTPVKNLCRDSSHKAKRDTPNYQAINHTIIGNTAFIKVLNNVLRGSKKGFHYFNNCIQDTKDYENTSREAHESGMLPYNSEIVVPIIPSIPDDNKNYDLIGFLCVDCESEHKFDDYYDPALIEGVADGIYDILSRKILIDYIHG